jgi:hypothetical protein
MSEPERAVTEREIDLTIVEAAERNITVNVAYRLYLGEGQELGDYVGSEPRRFPIRGSLPVPLMTAFLRLETRINTALARDDEEADRELEATMEDAHARIVGLIVERTPSAFDRIERDRDGEMVPVRPVIELDVSQILILLAWIAGDTSVADAVTKVLTAGRTSAKQTAEEAARIAAEADETEEAAETAAPFGSSGP